MRGGPFWRTLQRMPNPECRIAASDRHRHYVSLADPFLRERWLILAPAQISYSVTLSSSTGQRAVLCPLISGQPLTVFGRLTGTRISYTPIRPNYSYMSRTSFSSAQRFARLGVSCWTLSVVRDRAPRSLTLRKTCSRLRHEPVRPANGSREDTATVSLGVKEII